MPHMTLSQMEATNALLALLALVIYYVGFKAGQRDRERTWLKEMDRRRRNSVS